MGPQMEMGQRESQIVFIDPKMCPQMVVGQRESQIVHRNPKMGLGQRDPK